MPRASSATFRQLCDGLGWIAVGGLVVALLWLGGQPALSAHLYFHPGHDAWWRGLPAQLVHLNAAHLRLNLLALLGLAGLAGLGGRIAELPLALLAAALAVSSGLACESAPAAWYIGLSGALYGLAAWLAADLAWRSAARRIRLGAGLICLAIGAKATLGLGASANLGAPVALSAHVYGFGGGLGYFLLTRLWLRQRSA